MSDWTFDFPDRLEQYFRPTREDGWYLVTMTGAGFAAFNLTSQQSVIYAAAIITAIGYRQMLDGRLWWMLVVGWPAGWWAKRVQGGWFLRPDQPRTWYGRLWRWVQMRARSPTEDIEIHVINDELAVAYNKDDKNDTVLIVGDGSDTAMSWLATQAMDQLQLANAVKRLALVRELDIGLEWIRTYRPPDIRQTLGVLRRNLIPEVLPPPSSNGDGGDSREHADWGLDTDDVLDPSSGDGEMESEDELPIYTPTLEEFATLTDEQREEVLLVMPTLEELEGLTQEERDAICYRNVGLNYEKLLHNVLDNDSMATAALAITIKRDPNLAKQFKDQAKAPGGKGIGKLLRRFFKKTFENKSMAEDEEERLVVEELVKVAVEGLELAGVENPVPMDLRRMHAHFRYAFDVQQDDAYARWAAQSPDLTDRRFLPESHVRAQNGVLDIDNNYAAIVRVTGNPKTADPFTFRPLFAIDVPNLTVSTVSRVGASNQEVDLLEAQVAGREALNEEVGVWHKKQKRLEKEERTRHSLETVYAAKFRVRMNTVLVVLATDRKLLNYYLEKVNREINAIDGMRAKRIKNPYLLVHWFWTANGVPC